MVLDVGVTQRLIKVIVVSIVIRFHANLDAWKDAERLHDVDEWRAIVSILVESLLEENDAGNVFLDS